MSGSIFRETLRRHWRQVLYWGIGIGMLSFYLMVVIPDVDALKQYANMVSAMPPVILQMFGLSSGEALATPEGFIAFGLSYSLFIMAVFAVLAGLNVTANEEDSGILDMVLSQPLPRWRIIVEKFAAYTIITVGITLIGYLGLVIGSQLSNLEVDVQKMLPGYLNMAPSALVMLALTIFITTLVRRKSTATGIVVAVIAGSYFADFLGKAASNAIVDLARIFSFWAYYDGEAVVQNGLNIGNVVLLVASALILVAGSLWAFNRRDIGL